MPLQQKVWQPGRPWKAFRTELPNDWCLRITERYTVPFANGYTLQVTRAEHVEGWECSLEQEGRLVTHPDFPAGSVIVPEEEDVTEIVQKVARLPGR
jgi:hypothetical protein